jgi:hypothetical protein
MRMEKGPMSPDVLFDKLKSRRADAIKGSVYNMGPRWDGDLIRRTFEGWALIDPSRAPVLHAGYAWGPPSAFTKQELAAHRRIILLHILAAAPNGLLIVQIAEQLANSEACKAPASKDLVKVDMAVLERDRKVRKIGGSKRWTLAGPK